MSICVLASHVRSSFRTKRCSFHDAPLLPFFCSHRSVSDSASKSTRQTFPRKQKQKSVQTPASSSIPVGPTTAPLKIRSFQKLRGKAMEVPASHVNIIKIIESNRPRLRNQLKLLREREKQTIKSSNGKPRPVPKISTLPATVTNLDLRQTALSRLAVEADQPDQDHLTNITDFRIQTDILPYPSAPAAADTTSTVRKQLPKKKKIRADTEEMKRNRSKADEIVHASKAAQETSLRNANLKYLNSSLKAYVNVCGRVDMIDAAISSLGQYRERFPGEQDRKSVLDVEVYNRVLNIYAKKEKIHDVKKIFRWMKADGTRPNAKSFAYALETLGRASVLDRKTARKILQQMELEGIACNDLFTRNSYMLDEREKILGVIQSLHPDFAPVVKPPSSSYRPDILQCLNAVPNNTLYSTPYQGVSSHDILRRHLDHQIEREIDGIVTVKSVDPFSEPDSRTVRSRGKLQCVKAYWTRTLTQSFERNKEMIRQQHRPRGINVYPFLCSLSTKEYVDIMLHEIIQLGQASEGYSPSTLLLHLQTGRKVMEKYLINCKLDYKLVDRTRILYDEYLKYFENNKAVTDFNCRQYWQKLEHDMNLTMSTHLGDHVWPKSVVLRIGKLLYDIIINDVKIDTTILRLVENSQFAPAVYKVYRHYGDALKEEVKPHPVLTRLFKASVCETLEFESVMCPTIVPPLPWINTKTGGYLLRNSILVRLPEGPGAASMSGIAAAEYVPSTQLYPVFDSLNQLGASPWIINKPMLDLLIQVFRNKGMPDVDIPPPVSECPPMPKISKNLLPEELKAKYRERFLLKKKKNEMFSLWCDALYKLSIANHFRDEIFWFPHNIDFRGRVYPVPPHFHHLCGDMARSLLLFAKGVPLGETGLDWLKIHVINLTGLKKKSSIADRLAYASVIIDDILDSADNPLHGRQWWKNSDDPWQTLACCREIAAVTRSPDPTTFISHFPIHQDGSCNGLQHYAALGRDQQGAEQVNLVPFETPQDVYNGVAALVEKQRVVDAQNGIEIAKVLEGFVGRKVVKQTVMTIVYGVTRYGARGQIRGQLADLKELDQKKTWAGASYLAAKTFESIKQMFTATRKIQDWFVDCARLISSVRERPVEWITPVGLPVVQPYFKHKMGHDRKTMHTVLDPGKPNAMKQKNAFPPNFIHSLDSTHMMLTSLHAARAGITFVSVHDCYWTHPQTVHIMNKICREQFVALHSLPILNDLSEHFVKVYGYNPSELADMPPTDPRVMLNESIRAVPDKGSLNLEDVLKSVYFFS